MKTLTESTDNIFIQFLRYSFVGGFAFLVDFGLLFAFTEFFKIHYLVSGALSFCVGLLINYFLSVKWVFSKRKLNNIFLEFFVFTAIGLVGLALNELFLWLFTEQAHFHYLVSKAIATTIVWFWNFSARKFSLFN